MAAVSVTINGVIWDKQWRTARPVVLIGEAFLTGLEVGGGPIIPEGGGEHPAFPIWGPPGYRPGAGFPDKPGYPSIPDMPVEPPTDPGMVKPPPPDGGWGWHPEYGWGYFPGTGGAGPRK